MWIVLSVLVLVSGFAVVPASAQTPIDAGYRDLSYGTTGNSTPTGEKPETKLWWNDGFWWADLYNADPLVLAHHIYRLDLATHTWVDTGTALDSRKSSKGDAMWDAASGKLYLVSHLFDTNATPSVVAADWGRLYRYSYDAITKTYSLDAGFPVNITRGKSETLTIAKDSAGVLWITYVEGPDPVLEDSVVMINHSVGNDLTWGVPFALPVDPVAAAVKTDDISDITTFSGNKTGILWSNQVTGKFYFAVHNDGDSDVTWQAVETAFPVPPATGNSDDHLSLHSDASGRVFAAVKTSLTVSTDPLNLVVVRDTLGAWTSHVFGTVADHHTRGILLLDVENQQVYMFATNPENNINGAIYYKVTDMNNIAFPAGQGTPFIKSATELAINNISSTKQNLNSTTGLLAIASDQNAHFYFHNYLPITPANVAPVITSFTPAIGPEGTEVTLTGTGFSGTTAVKFNGQPAESFIVDSSTTLRAIAPTGVSTGKISVTNPQGTALSASDFEVTYLPWITSFTPGSGAVGTIVTINGSAFEGATAVTFNGTPASFTYFNDGLVRATVPAGATTGPILITTPIGTRGGNGTFRVLRVPAITSFSPANGPVGTLVTINGSGFTGVTSVKFNGKAATGVVVVSDSVITAKPTTGTTTGKISVTNSQGTALSAADFIIIPKPTLTSFTPSHGPVGTLVTINGTGFTFATAVMFRTTVASFTIISDTQIKATVPAGATTGKIKVTNPAGSVTSASNFLVP